MGRESTQTKLQRVRPPRVQIKYEVETGNAIEIKEIPFVVGVMADLSGKREKPLEKLSDGSRKFVQIDRDNFDKVMEGIEPRLAYKAENKLEKDGSKIGVELKFKSMDDFAPERVVNQVEPLRKLMEVRRQLSGLLAKTDGNDRLNEELEKIIGNTELQKQIGKEAGIDPKADTKG